MGEKFSVFWFTFSEGNGDFRSVSDHLRISVLHSDYIFLPQTFWSNKDKKDIFTKIKNILCCWLIFSVVAKFKVWIVNVFLANPD